MSSLQIPQDIETTSACYARQPVTGDHTLRELPLCGKLNIRADSSQLNVLEAMGSALNLTLPVTANTKATNDSLNAYWMGPDEWLVHCPLDQSDSIAQKMKDQCASFHHAVVDVSDYYTVLELTGPQAEGILRRGCPLDIHPGKFPTGSIAQTRFGHASILLDKQDEFAWNIHVRWTYAEYVWDYIVSAMEAV